MFTILTLKAKFATFCLLYQSNLASIVALTTLTLLAALYLNLALLIKLAGLLQITLIIITRPLITSRLNSDLIARSVIFSISLISLTQQLNPTFLVRIRTYLIISRILIQAGVATTFFLLIANKPYRLKKPSLKSSESKARLEPLLILST